MTFISDFAALFQDKNVQVTIDPLLLPQIDSADKLSTTRNVRFNIYRLIIHIGTIQSRRFAPSNRVKLLDKMDLVDKIYRNTNEFRIRINEIRQVNGSETLKTISEDFGVGISIVIAESLFRTKPSTIQKIYGTRKRPDWNCQLNDNRILIVEAKGTIDINTSRTQEADALEQKTKEQGDTRIASLTIINENCISTTRYLDPPTTSNDNSPIMENHILRAGHYASVFSFLGNSKLSRYYSQMRRRLEGLITPIEQDVKNQTFKDLKLNDPTIQFKNEYFVGHFFEIEYGNYLFVGVNKRLISYEGFVNFVDYENDTDEVVDENHFILYKDGILFIEIRNIRYFSNVIDVGGIKNYQDNITISDIDEMNEISFSKYFEYILSKNNFEDIVKETIINNLVVDLRATYMGVDFYFEFKIFNSRIGERNLIQQFDFYKHKIGKGKFVLVTNLKVNSRKMADVDSIIIDRAILQKIVKNISILMQALRIKSDNA